MEQNIMLFSLSSNLDLAKEIASAMNMELSSCEMKRFAFRYRNSISNN